MKNVLRRTARVSWLMQYVTLGIVVYFTLIVRAEEPAPLKPSRFSPAETQLFVEYHNKVRREVKAPPVKWSNELAAYAQQWADQIATTGKREHRPWDGEGAKHYGENMAFGSTPNYSVIKLASTWYEEKKDYVSGSPIPPLSEPFKVGHYTQMVWSTTTEIGAGKAVIQVGERKGWTVVVCNYNPPGNRAGEKPY